jgi:SAM-dependent methyltransferase
VIEALSASRGRYYFAIFVIACATLSYQILMTRFFSVILYYHFAFAAISLAMLGLTRGAIHVFQNPERYTAENVAEQVARHAALFAITGVGTMAAFLCAPLVVPTDLLTRVMPAATLAFVLPFTQSGICITLLLTRLPFGGGWMYAADLSGAALGCLGVILALLVVDPVSATLWMAAFTAGAGWLLAADGRRTRAFRLAGTVAVTIAAVAALHTGLSASGRGLGVFWAKGEVQTGTLFERWNTYSRVRVVARGVSAPEGWGFARTPDVTIDQHHIDIDADAGTVITRFDGDLSKVAFLKNDVVNAAYLVQPTDHVAVIGVGGGRDILSARYFGAKRITGIEINPAIFEVLTDKFADFAGHIDKLPGVSLVNAEARSYINHSPERYDLVQISLIDTWAATAAGGLTLTENRLYTVEAWQDFYRALNPGGMLSVSRWYHADAYYSEFYRLVGIAATALENTGVPATELRHHVIAANAGDIVTVITRPEAFTDAAWRDARTALEAQGFKILLGPDVAFDDVTSTILAGNADAAYYDSLPENVAPSTDDRPFFFYTTRLRDFFSGAWSVVAEATAAAPDSEAGGKRSTISRIIKAIIYAGAVPFKNNIAVATTVVLIIGTLAACLYYVGIPFVRLARRMPLSVLSPPVAYFSAIGMGFMLIEVAQMQRLMVFLGHPVYGLAVVLFALLLFSGIGSATVGRQPAGALALAFRVAGLLIVLVAVGVLTPGITAWARSSATDVRILLSILLLAPAGLFMGMMFPLGLGIWRRHSELLPFFWSANGITSMLASVVGVALSMEFGIAETYATGVVFYAGCAIIVLVARRSPAKLAASAAASGMVAAG